jgi:hypothetical protein
MTTPAAPTVLTWAQRYLLAHDESFGGGNLLQAELRANPRPDVLFIRRVRPVPSTDSRPLREPLRAVCEGPMGRARLLGANPLSRRTSHELFLRAYLGRRSA